MNRNKSLKWLRMQESFEVDEKVLQSKIKIRGVYGIFINCGSGKECVYVGKSTNLYFRLFKGEGHVVKMMNKNHWIIELNNNNDKTIYIRILEEVPYVKDNYYKDLQRLSSRENYYIDKYQSINQCLFQVPEGNKISKQNWNDFCLND